MPEIGSDDVWAFIYRNGETSYTELINRFVEKGKGKRTCAKQTLINYKRRLENQGKIGKKISEETRRPVYYVPKEVEPEIRILIEKLEIKKNLEKLSLEELIELKKELEKEVYGKYFK